MIDQLIIKNKLKIAKLKKQLPDVSDIKKNIIKHQVFEIELFILELKLLKEHKNE